MTRYGLRDDQWERIKDWLPGRVGHVGATAQDNRRFVEAVLYRYRAGIPWRDFAGAIWRLEEHPSPVQSLGLRAGSGKKSSNISPPTPITNMR